MAIATAATLSLLVAFMAPWRAAEAAVPVLAALVGFAGAWLQAVHPPASAYEHETALLALLVV